jgi:hypothetical protein
MKPHFLLALLLTITSPSFAQQRVVVQPDPAFTAHLTELAKSSNLKPLFETASRPKNNEELKSALDWMRAKAVDGSSRDPRYLMSYALLLQAAQIKDMAAAIYLTGVLIGRLESARCLDTSASAPKIRLLEAETKALENEYWAFPFRQRIQFLIYAVELEKMKPLGQPNSWLCSGGLRDFEKVLDKAIAGGSTEGISRRATTTGGSEMVIDTSGISPSFLSDKESEPMRREIKERFDKFYFREKPAP